MSVIVNEPVVGMMNETYFKSRSELLSWVNSLLHLNVQKVEELATGAIHCQILDAMYPRKVKMSKVNFGARYDHEFTLNFKVLQDAFTKLGVKKIVPIQRLIKAKYQDNLEFLQWMHHFFHCNYSGQEYNAEERRSKCKGVQKMKKTLKENNSAAVNKPKRNSGGKHAKPISARYSSKASGDSKRSNSEAKALKAKLDQCEKNMKILLKERDFYFNKIVEMEKHCVSDDFKDTELSKTLQKIMYEQE
uniref:Uncharacterized protein n=1 Tax=Lotharella oceanica TaxID=641309 RepID=A0A7S2TV26_9EUKA